MRLYSLSELLSKDKNVQHNQQRGFQPFQIGLGSIDLRLDEWKPELLLEARAIFRSTRSAEMDTVGKSLQGSEDLFRVVNQTLCRSHCNLRAHSQVVILPKSPFKLL